MSDYESEKHNTGLTPGNWTEDEKAELRGMANQLAELLGKMASLRFMYVLDTPTSAMAATTEAHRVHSAARMLVQMDREGNQGVTLSKGAYGELMALEQKAESSLAEMSREDLEFMSELASILHHEVRKGTNGSRNQPPVMRARSRMLGAARPELTIRQKAILKECGLRPEQIISKGDEALALLGITENIRDEKVGMSPDKKKAIQGLLTVARIVSKVDKDPVMKKLADYAESALEAK